MNIKAFCFNAFSENTYVIYSDEGNCWIIDPGCSNRDEQSQLVQFIENNGLTPQKLLLTHAHIDHILGCSFVYDSYGLLPLMHPGELETLRSGVFVAKMYGVPYTPCKEPEVFLREGDILDLDGNEWLCLFTPGHSPASLCFFSNNDRILIAGDVLFEGSIGRTDLPGGNYQMLISNIKSKLFPLGADVIVYPGHGGATTIGQERLTNPFLT